MVWHKQRQVILVGGMRGAVGGGGGFFGFF